jgi:hypothetical protein
MTFENIARIKGYVNILRKLIGFFKLIGFHNCLYNQDKAISYYRKLNVAPAVFY